MRCPKCHYLAFDSGERCRNCGYEFALALEAEDAPSPPELSIRATGPDGPLADLTLRPETPPGTRPRRRTTRGRPRSTERSTSDLPLFLDPDPANRAPLVRATPRAPLSVRATPARIRTPPPEMWSPPAAATGDDPSPPPGRTPVRDTPAGVTPRPELRPLATPADRVVAGCIDLVLVLAIDVGILYFTVRILDLPMAAILTLPRVPLLAFLALLNGGYFVVFTVAGGQTIGKMAKQIQVVGRDGTVHVGQAVTRTLGYFVSALPVGLGFVAMALGPDGVALHDRLADTRVVRCHPS